MSTPFIFLLVICEIFAIVFACKVLTSERGYFEKLALVVVLCVPFLGPLLYLFLIENVPPQHPWLRNSGARGDYTHNMIGIQADLDELERQRVMEAELEAVKPVEVPGEDVNQNDANSGKCSVGITGETPTDPPTDRPAK